MALTISYKINMLSELKKLNPNIPMYDIYSTEFSMYGRVIDNIDTSEIIKVAKKIQSPKSGSSYVPSQPEFEELSVASDLQNKLFGEIPTETGYCWGHNSFLNALEWHTSSEINIAVTPLVLILGTRFDLKDNKLDCSKLKAFFVPEGAIIEVYATSLHFCPCEVKKEGFGCVVVLPDGTNTQLVLKPKDKYLFRKNKWLIAHNDNANLISRGAVPGISGENLKIKY